MLNRMFDLLRLRVTRRIISVDDEECFGIPLHQRILMRDDYDKGAEFGSVIHSALIRENLCAQRHERGSIF